MANTGSDVEKNKGIAIASYFVFFLPLLIAKDSKFAMYHANQGLLLLIFIIAINIIAVIPILGWIVSFFGYIASLVLLIIGIMNAANGQMKPLPFIGNYTIIK